MKFLIFIQFGVKKNFKRNFYSASTSVKMQNLIQTIILLSQESISIYNKFRIQKILV